MAGKPHGIVDGAQEDVSTALFDITHAGLQSFNQVVIQEPALDQIELTQKR